MASQKPTQPPTDAPAAPPAQSMISLDSFFDEITDEIRQAEQLVRAKEAELAQAREQLAGARGKLQLLGQMQRAARGGS